MIDWSTVGLALGLSLGPAAAFAQNEPGVAQVRPEDVQPLTIGASGTTMIGVAGYLDKVASSERLFPTNLTVQVDVGRFVTRRLVARGGLVGSASLGGEDADDLASGPGVPALHAFAGLHVYATPQSIASVYAGVEYWAQLTRRAETDAGSLLGRLGVQGAVSSRMSLFLEAGYGIGLTRGEEGERLSRLVGQVGVRFKL